MPYFLHCLNVKYGITSNTAWMWPMCRERQYDVPKLPFIIWIYDVICMISYDIILAFDQHNMMCRSLPMCVSQLSLLFSAAWRHLTNQKCPPEPPGLCASSALRGLGGLSVALESHRVAQFTTLLKKKWTFFPSLARFFYSCLQSWDLLLSILPAIFGKACREAFQAGILKS